MSITYSERASVAWGIQHAMRMRKSYCHQWTDRLCSVFPHYLIKCTIFEKKKKLRSIKSVFWFSLKLLFETFLILRRTERDVIKKMYTGLNEKYPLLLSDCNETWIFSTCFRKMLKHQTSWNPGQWEPSCSTRTVRQTDVLKVTDAFANSANTPKNCIPYRRGSLS